MKLHNMFDQINASENKLKIWNTLLLSNNTPHFVLITESTRKIVLNLNIFLLPFNMWKQFQFQNVEIGALSKQIMEALMIANN